MTTARTLITDSLMACGQYGQGQTPTNADYQLGVRQLQRLLDSWSNDSLQIWTTVDMTEPTVAGTASYELTNFDLDGVTPATAADQRVPVSIQNAWLRDGSIDYPLSEITEDEYNSIPAKSSQGLPEVYFFKRYRHIYANDAVPPDSPTPDDLRGKLYLYPTPDKAYTLHVMGRLQLGTAIDLDSTIVFPPGGELMVMENLAVSLCKFFGIQVDPEMQRSATVARMALAPTNHRAPRMCTGLPGSGYTTPSYVRQRGDT